MVPTRSGMWTPWFPFALVQRWPFCWWVAVAVDQASRRLVGFAVFARGPTSRDVSAFLDRAIKGIGACPRHVVTDKGKEFFCRAFRAWCKRRGIRPRTGAVGKHKSIAIVERFIRSMKSECTRRILVPLELTAMCRELSCYGRWYNEHRPHSALGGRTPLEVYEARAPANRAPRIEPRPRWPRGARCARPNALALEPTGARLALNVRYLDGRKHLPIIEITTAA